MLKETSYLLWGKGEEKEREEEDGKGEGGREEQEELGRRMHHCWPPSRYTVLQTQSCIVEFLLHLSPLEYFFSSYPDFHKLKTQDNIFVTPEVFSFSYNRTTLYN